MSIFPTHAYYIADGDDCRQEQGYDEVKGGGGSPWFGQDMCHEYSTCEYDPDVQMFKCKCEEGFEGDGYDCQPEKGVYQ